MLGLSYATNQWLRPSCTYYGPYLTEEEAEAQRDELASEVTRSPPGGLLGGGQGEQALGSPAARVSPLSPASLHSPARLPGSQLAPAVSNAHGRRSTMTAGGEETRKMQNPDSTQLAMNWKFSR